jgi:putative ABC transport system ATP-binding protein
MPLLAFEHVTRSYPDGLRRIVVLERASFEVYAGDFVGILGPPRAGKSTLLRLAAGIESPDHGTVSFEGHDIARMSALERDRLLRNRIGVLATDDWHPGRGERAVDLVALPIVRDRRPCTRPGAVPAGCCTGRGGGPRQARPVARWVSARAMLAGLVRERPAAVDEPAVIRASTSEALHGLLLSARTSTMRPIVLPGSLRVRVHRSDLAYGELLDRVRVLPFPARLTA